MRATAEGWYEEFPRSDDLAPAVIEPMRPANGQDHECAYRGAGRRARRGRGEGTARFANDLDSEVFTGCERPTVDLAIVYSYQQRPSETVADQEAATNRP